VFELTGILHGVRAELKSFIRKAHRTHHTNTRYKIQVW